MKETFHFRSDSLTRFPDDELKSKYTLNRFLLYMICIFLASPGFTQYMAREDQPGSLCLGYIHISGETNLNHFNLSSNLSFIILSEASGDKGMRQDSSMIEIPVPLKEFSASNPLIYRDFLELLNASVYPNVFIGVKYPYLEKIFYERENTVSQIEITLAGVTRDYRIPCRVMNCSNDYVYLIGSREIKLTEFNLEPPEKFQGLVRVKDSVLIKFGIVFRFQPEINLTSFEGKH